MQYEMTTWSKWKKNRTDGIEYISPSLALFLPHCAIYCRLSIVMGREYSTRAECLLLTQIYSKHNYHRVPSALNTLGKRFSLIWFRHLVQPQQRLSALSLYLLIFRDENNNNKYWVHIVIYRTIEKHQLMTFNWRFVFIFIIVIESYQIVRNRNKSTEKCLISRYIWIHISTI